MTLSAADRLAILEVITRADDAPAAGTPTPTSSCSRRTPCWTAPRACTPAVRHCAPRSGRMSAEGPATLHLTLNPVIEPCPSDDQAVHVRTAIIDPARHPIRTAAAITQELRRTDGSWRITRRTVATAPRSAEGKHHGPFRKRKRLAGPVARGLAATHDPRPFCRIPSP